MQEYKPGGILKASEESDVKQLEQCINLGANVDEQDSMGRTPLSVACSLGYQPAVELLIARKANVNLKTTLLIAVISGRREICEILLRAGADKTVKADGKTAAQWAADKDLAALIESWGQVCCVFLRERLSLIASVQPPAVSSAESKVNVC